MKATAASLHQPTDVLAHHDEALRRMNLVWGVISTGLFLLVLLAYAGS